jgi:ubiquinone/menaquinone biosynthesis C-methylase UbiE
VNESELAQVNSTPANFDRLARVYRMLELAAFGRDLERARFCLLDRLSHCQDILVLGEGDGRCVQRLLSAAPEARIHCIDASGAMIARAVRRLGEGTRFGGSGASWFERVSFERANAFSAAFPPSRYDAAVTLFFLDCFSTAEVRVLIDRIQPSLRPGASWLFADFAVPPGRAARTAARLCLAILYAFFRWQTGLSARELPDSERALEQAGWRKAEECSMRRGLLRSVLFKRAGQYGPRIDAATS